MFTSKNRIFTDEVIKMASEENLNEITTEGFWKNLARRYWYFVLIFGLLLVGAIIGFVLTFNWYIATSALGGYGSWTFDQFSLGTAIVWCLFLCLWTLLFVALPTLAVAGLLVAIIWFVVLSPELKEEIKTRMKTPRPRKRESGSGGFTFLLFIGLCIYVFMDGNWLTPFGSLSIGYFAYAWITVFIWAAIIFSIPAVIIGIYWLARKHS